MEYQFTVSLSNHGHELENGEKLSHGFANSHPETEAVVEDFRKAIRRGAAILDAATWS